MKGEGNPGSGIILINPPAAKTCEAPGGPARLAGALRRHGVACRIWDANLEGQLALLKAASRGVIGAGVPSNPESTGEKERGANPRTPGEGSGTLWGGDQPSDTARSGQPDAWTRRAARHLPENLNALRSRALYANPARYRRAVADMNRLLAIAARPHGVRLSLADYEDSRLSPVRSGDLRSAAATPESSPFYAWFSERLPEVIEEYPLSHVGFSVNYLSQALTAFAMIGFIRRTHPSLKIVLGGGLVTSWMRSPCWKNPFVGFVDELIAGAGEVPLLALFGKVHDGGHDRPDFDGFPLADYLAPGAVLPYSASSGCWWRRCSFCPETAEGNPYRPVPPGRVAADLRDLTSLLRPALIHLLDNALSPAHLAALAGNPPGAPWYGFVRITPHLADPEFCARLRDAGCVMLKLGIESGDQKVLDALNKGIGLDTAAAVLANLRAAGIATYVYLLFGTPAETPEAARRTLAFTAAHAPEIGFLNLAIFNLPAFGPEMPGLDTGEFYAGDLPLYRPFVHPGGWNRGDVRHFLENEFKRHPAVAVILRRDPPFFTSNHAPFIATEN